MKKYKRKAGHFLLVVFAAILLPSFFQSADTQFEKAEEVAVVHKHETSGEAPGNVSRSFVDQSNFDGRILNDFSLQSIQEFHSQLTHVEFVRLSAKQQQFKSPEKVFKQIRKLLI